MKITLTLCTKNGGTRLEKCLAHISALDAPESMQLLLVDNGSTDGRSFLTLQQFAEHCRFDCSVLQTFVPGNSAGRNLALEKADGDIHLFIDDDCYVESRFVLSWLSVFGNHAVGYASGRIERYTQQYSKLGCNESLEEEYIDAGEFVPRGFVQGSNMAFTKECLSAAGSFDERFGAGTIYAGEEWDLALRASLLGYSGGYFPQPRVAHDHRRTDAEALERLTYYDYGAGAVYAKQTTSTKGFLVLKKFFGELWRLRADQRRFRGLAKGYMHFMLKK